MAERPSSTTDLEHAQVRPAAIAFQCGGPVAGVFGDVVTGEGIIRFGFELPRDGGGLSAQLEPADDSVQAPEDVQEHGLIPAMESRTYGRARWARM